MKIYLYLKNLNSKEVDEYLDFFQIIKDVDDTMEIIKNFSTDEIDTENLVLSKSKNIAKNLNTRLKIYKKNKIPNEIHLKITEEEPNIVRVISQSFNIDEKFTFYDRSKTIKNIFANIMGYKSCTLKGMSVKNPEGVKIKPDIDIYYKEKFCCSLPSVLEYTKKQVQTPLLHSQRICFISNSEILKSVLHNNTLIFYGNDTFYKLSSHEQSFFITKYGKSSDLVSDLLYSTSSISTYLEVIKHPSSELGNKIMKMMASCENPQSYKDLHSIIQKDVKYTDFPYLYMVLECSPKFYDYRDSFISNLKNFLSEKAPTTRVSSFNYLEVKRKKIAFPLSSHSLSKIFAPSYEKHI